MTDVEALARPLEGENPDLSYDSERLEIEQCFAPGGEEENGPVDWRKIVGIILEQAEKTRDAWLPVYLARAGARWNRLETVEQACLYLAGLYENCWDSMHPTLEELDFQGRKAPCESLVSIAEFLGPLRRMTYVAHNRLGAFSGEDLERFATDGDSADGYGMFRAALDELEPEALQETLGRLSNIREALGRVDSTLSGRAGPGASGTNFAPAYAALDQIRRSLAQFAGEPVEEAGAEGEEAGEGDTSAAPRPSTGGSLRGAIESREDVLRVLDSIIDYYRRREPTSPVPVAINRAKSWVNMDFLALIRDITPDSLDEARKVLTSPPVED